MSLPRRFCKLNCEHFPNEPDLQRFSGRNALKSGGKNQCLPDSWSICLLRVWILHCSAIHGIVQPLCGFAWPFAAWLVIVQFREVQRYVLCALHRIRRSKSPEMKKPCAAFDAQHRAFLCFRLLFALTPPFFVSCFMQDCRSEAVDTSNRNIRG